jgi:hypothetical protein
MTQASVNADGSSTRSAAFFWIAIGMLAALVLCGATLAVLLVSEARSINNAGGWGWLLIGGVYAVVATVVCLASAVCAAVSLLRREAHRRLSIALLILCCLEVWTFRHSLAYLAGFKPNQGMDPVSDGGSGISDSLVRHFGQSGLVLRPQARHRGFETEWILANADVGPQCEVVTSFRRFPTGTSVESMKNQLMAISQPSVLNERAALAMFHPHARGKTSNRNDCDAWSAKSREITDRVLDAFRSYQPIAVRVSPNTRP